MAYSEEDKQEFKNKDLRISRLSMLKSLIESLSVEEIYDVEKVCNLSEQYVKYVYSVASNTGSGIEKPDVVNWVEVAEGIGIAAPNSKNIEILDLIWDEYKAKYKLSANPAILLTTILDKYKKYPANLNSVSKVMKSFEN